MSVYVSQECCLYSEACLEAISEPTPHGLHTAVRTGLQVPGKIILLDRSNISELGIKIRLIFKEALKWRPTFQSFSKTIWKKSAEICFLLPPFLKRLFCLRSRNFGKCATSKRINHTDKLPVKFKNIPGFPWGFEQESKRRNFLERSKRSKFLERNLINTLEREAQSEKTS